MMRLVHGVAATTAGNAALTRAVASLACVLCLSSGAAFAQGSPVLADPQLQQARQAFEQLNFEAARDVLSSLIDRLSQREGDEAERRVLATAYELRGRTLLNLRDQDGARADFRAMLILEPGYPFPPEAGARAAALFEEVRAATVGIVEIAITPADADVQIDGRPASDRPLRLALVSGFHSVKASRRGYASLTQQFEVRSGESATIPVLLVRELTTLTLRTIPSNVTVIVDGTPRGVTQPASAIASASDSGGVSLSAPLVIEEILNGAHRLELRRDCFVTDQRQIDVQKPEDLRLDVVRLTRAVGTITVTSREGGGTLFVDGTEHGTVPQVIEECQGPHVVEVRTRSGRDIRRFDVKTGAKEEFAARVRPAFAIVAESGAAAANDARLDAERAFRDAGTLTFFAPPKAGVDQIAAAAGVGRDWLAFDVTGTPINDATAVSETARRAAGERVAQALAAQGVAAIGRDVNGDPRAMLLTLLAPGSAKPDVLRWRADDSASIQEVLTRLDASPALTRRSLGMLALDVLDVQGIVVGAVEPGGGAAAAGLQPGDVVTAIAGQPVTGAASLAAAVATSTGPQLAVDLRDRTGAVKKVDVPVHSIPSLVAPSDESVLANTRAVALTGRVSVAAPPIEAASLRLNLASAWMRLENWAAAARELSAVESIVSGAQIPVAVKDRIIGNAQYLLGECAVRMGNPQGAEQAWTRAAESAGGLLWDGGEPLKELAGRRLAELRNPTTRR